MARFYGAIQGSRGLASRLGTKGSGMFAHVRGWNAGVRVECTVGPDGEDIIRVYETGGSNFPGNLALLAEVRPRVDVPDEEIGGDDEKDA